MSQETCTQHHTIEDGMKALFVKADSMAAAVSESTARIREMTVQMNDLIDSLRPLAGNGKPAISTRMMLAEERIDRLLNDKTRRAEAVWKVVTGLVLAVLSAAVVGLWKGGP